MNPKLIIEQKIIPVVNKYGVYIANPDGSKGQIASFARQDMLADRITVHFYSDEQETQELFRFRDEKVIALYGRVFVEEPNGTVVGIFKKEFTKSFGRSTWSILDTSGQPKVTIIESSRVFAAVRRILGQIIGNDFLKKYGFTLIDTASGQPIGEYKRLSVLRSRYILSMTDSYYQQQDWRVLASLGVALDELQNR